LNLIWKGFFYKIFLFLQNLRNQLDQAEELFVALSTLKNLKNLSINLSQFLIHFFTNLL